MRHSGFTMIEMIFVIVILGILAAVAIPKMAATREDAFLSRKAQNIMTTVAEIASYAVAKSNVETDFTQMSSTARLMQGTGEITLTPDQADYKEGSAVPCIRLAVHRNAEGVDLNISMQNSGVDPLCDRLHGLIDANIFPIKLRGKGVVYD